MVHHAILERYTEYKITGDEDLLVGRVISYEDAVSSTQKITQITLPNEGTYYNLENYTEGNEQISPLKQLGLKVGGSEDEDLISEAYIVNYEKGITINTTTQVVDGEELFRTKN